MAPYSIDIELDAPSPAYQPGDAISGSVQIDAHSDCIPDVLRIGARWRTEGPGDPSTDSPVSETFFPDTWTEGEHYEYPFELSLPNGPCSYDGALLTVIWELTAQVDVSGESNIVATRQIRVAPGDDPVELPYQAGDPTSEIHELHDIDEEGDSESVSTGGWGFLAFLFVVGAAIQAIIIYSYQMDPDLNSPLIILVFGAIGLVMCGLSIWGFWSWFLRNHLAERKLAEMNVEVSPLEVRAGEHIDIHIDIPPESNVDLRGITASLEGKEQAIFSTGSSASNVGIRTHEFPTLQWTIAETINRTIERGESAAFACQFMVPDQAPGSFVGGGNIVEWSLKLEVDIPRWPNWSDEWKLRVVPGPHSLTAQLDPHPWNQAMNSD